MALFISTVWTTLLWLASATGLDPSGLFSFPGQSSIDLLGFNISRFERIRGPNQHDTMAYSFTGDHRNLEIPQLAVKKVSTILRTNLEFTISVTLKQIPGNVGTILAMSEGKNYLELQSSGRMNEIRLHYNSRQDSKLHTETFRYHLADDQWHDVVVSVSGSQVDLLVDCETKFKKHLRHGMINMNFTDSARMWLGHTNNLYFFKGAIEKLRLTSGPYGYLPSCPHQDSTCPTCGQFFVLQNTVEELTRHLEALSQRLVAAEKRISAVEECDCQKSCQVNNSVYADGATWQSGCDLCSCVHGEVKCNPVQCPELPCKHPVIKNGECCHTCLKHCLFYGQFYDHGELVTFKKCVECKCNDGNMNCSKTDPETNCPKLSCPPEEQFSTPDHCCKLCKGVDYCAKGHNCHDNATCLNLQTTYTCQCDQGFQGDGKLCTDVDECQKQGDTQGHHCHQNTKCVNTPGSYICECLPGYRRIDKFNCAELDECSTGEHNCDRNAECVNTLGSYHCVCKEGYSGDGNTCEPICERPCVNGGKCSSPGKCTCLSGYTGVNCELDLDECEKNLHRCSNSSSCVNKNGWYYCQCKQGYTNLATYDNNFNNLGTECTDINECDTDLHTCHPSAQCINTDGGFICECPLNRPCKLNCIFEESEFLNGITMVSKKDSCVTCTCDKGVMRCEKPKCDCNESNNENNVCCPQCNPEFACHHQEVSGLILMHGEKWSYQCRECDCLYGEIDCGEMKCPPLMCDNPVRNDDDCCPHCPDNPCAFGNSSAIGQPCIFTDKFYQSGTEFVDPKDSCTICNCKDGMLCCSYNYRDHKCNDNVRSVGYDGMVASTTANYGFSHGFSESVEATTYPNKQYSATVRMADISDRFNTSDLQGIKIENPPQPGG